VFTLAKFITITPATVTSDTHHCSCHSHLGQCGTDRIVSVSCRVAQGGQGKYCHTTQGDCRVTLSLTVSPTNVANVNEPLSGVYTGKKTLYIVAITSSGDLKRWENFY
jgi:hypothetical protein